MPTHLTLQESRELLALCNSGKLKQVEDWIRAGRSITVHPKSRDCPLNAVLRKGYFSLLELLARHCDSQKRLNDVTLQAVRRQKFDFVRVLVENGADPYSVPFSDAVCAWDPEMPRYFMNKGCDIFANDALARALTYCNQGTLWFLVDYKRDHPERMEDLQYQVDQALAIQCRNEDKKGVAMMMWAGGDPYAKVRDLERKENQDKPWCLICGAYEAARKGNTEILKLLNLDPTHPDAQDLLEVACYGIHVSAVSYLLRIGISPNDKENGGSSGLDIILMHMDWGLRFKRILPSYSCTASDCLRIAKALIRHRAKWTPEPHELRAARRAICQVEPRYASELVELLKRPGVCDPEILAKFAGTARMRELLKD